MYRRNYFRTRSAKFSNETCAVNVQATQAVAAGFTFPQFDPPDPSQGQIAKGLMVVPATTIMGTRKVKNITLKLTARGNESPIVGALIYVPEGTQASDLSTQLSTSSLYEPNQNVIMTFILPPSVDRDPDGFVTQMFTPPTTTVSNRLARNLSSGDMLVLVMACVDDVNAGDGTVDAGTGRTKDPMAIFGTVNFAIKY